MKPLKKDKHGKKYNKEEVLNLLEEEKKIGHAEIDSNGFLNESFKKDTYTENGALSNSTTGNILIDDFSKSATYRDRDIEDVFLDMNKMWSVNSKKTLQTIFYLRLITRKSKGFMVTDKLQKGQGNRDESLKRMLWLAYNHPKTFYRNLWIIPLVGAWKDLFTLLSMDSKGLIRKKKVFKLIKKGLKDEYNSNLVKKYLPQIKSNSKVFTDRAVSLNGLAKELRTYLKLDSKGYRKLKSSGEGHDFQKDISKGLYSQLNWSKIPGKAMLNLVNSEFLSNQNLEEVFLKWLDKQDSVNFNGYPYELGQKVKKLRYSNIVQKSTIDKQFKKLIENSQKDTKISGNVLCALDTSGSMQCQISQKSELSAFDVCVSLGIYFSSLNTGAFKDVVAMFDDTSYMKRLNGSFTDKYKDITNEKIAWGSTNFQSLIEMLVEKRKTHPEIPVSDYPETLLVVSDMQFNPVHRVNGIHLKEANYEYAMRKLKEVGLEEIKIIWWNVNGKKGMDVPSTLEDQGTYFLSGFDGSIISSILGGEEEKPTTPQKNLSMEEVYEKVLGQEILQQIKE